VNVLYVDANAEMYEVQDEDDASRTLKLEACDVRKLADVSATLRRGDRVLAVFPETTCFYSGIVAKHPNHPKSGSSSSSSNDIIVKFDDDEDDQGKPLARKVPARFVLPPEHTDEDDDSDV
jgi:hypothetical protein